MNPVTGLRVLSLVIYLSYIIGALKILSMCFSSPATQLLGGILLAFWPSSILEATRVSNDVLIDALSAAALFFLFRWARLRNVSDLFLAGYISVSSVMVKTNGVILISVFAGSLGWALLRGQIPWRTVLSKRSLRFGAFTAFAALINFSRVLTDWMRGKPEPMRWHLGGHMSMPISLDHFLSFGVKHFISPPFIDYDHEPSFWSYLFKSLLFGVFPYNYPEHASVVSVLFCGFMLLIVFNILLSLLFRVRTEAMDNVLAMPQFLAVFVSFAAMIVFVTLRRWEVCQDARFIHPVTIPLVLYFVTGVDAAFRRRSSTVFGVAGVAVGLALPVAGVLLFLRQYLALW